MSYKAGCTLLAIGVFVVIAIVLSVLPPVWTHWLIYPLTSGFMHWIGFIVLIAAIIMFIAGWVFVSAEYDSKPAIGWPMIILAVVIMIIVEIPF